MTFQKKDIPKIKEKVKGVDGNGVGNKGTDNLSYSQKVDKYQERTQAIRDNLPNKYKKILKAK